MAHRDFEGLERRRRRSAQMFAQGATQAEVARRLRVSRPSALRWYRAWAKEGEEGLRGAGRAGRKPRMSDAQCEQLQQALIARPVYIGWPEA